MLGRGRRTPCTDAEIDSDEQHTLRTREFIPKTSGPRAGHRGRWQARVHVGQGSRGQSSISGNSCVEARVPGAGCGRQQLSRLQCEEAPDTRQPGIRGRRRGRLDGMVMAARTRRAFSVPGQLTTAIRMSGMRGAVMLRDGLCDLVRGASIHQGWTCRPKISGAGRLAVACRSCNSSETAYDAPEGRRREPGMSYQ